MKTNIMFTLIGHRHSTFNHISIKNIRYCAYMWLFVAEIEKESLLEFTNQFPRPIPE